MEFTMLIRHHISSTLAILAAVPWAIAEDNPPPGPATNPTLEERLAELDQEIRILKRKAELADEAAAAKAKTSTSASASDRGFSLTSADKGFSLKIGAYAQADGRFFLSDDSDVVTERNTDQFLIRRARLIISGTLAPWLEYRIMPDFASSTILTDAYLTGRFSPYLNATAGLQKPAVSLERLRSGTALTFLERGYPTNLAPNRDVGLQLGGDLGTVASWNIGIFNGTADGGSSAGDANDDKDAVARLWLTPFSSSTNDWVRGLGFGAAGSIGYVDGTPTTTNLPTHRSVGQATIFQYVRPSTGQTLANTVIPKGEQTRIAPQLFWTAGPFSLLGEYTISEQEVRRGTTIRESVAIDAYQIQIGWVITGEDASWRGVKPKSAYAPGNGQWGAWEIAGRITGIDFSEATEVAGLTTAASVEKATTIGAVINWYVNANLKWQLDGEFTQFDGGRGPGLDDRDDELVVSTRLQFAF